jgi:hypothetical protein
MVSGMVAVISPAGQLALVVVVVEDMTRCVRCFDGGYGVGVLKKQHAAVCRGALRVHLAP